MASIRLLAALPVNLLSFSSPLLSVHPSVAGHHLLLLLPDDAFQSVNKCLPAPLLSS
jgi:hypothetical protein